MEGGVLFLTRAGSKSSAGMLMWVVHLAASRLSDQGWLALDSWSTARGYRRAGLRVTTPVSLSCWPAGVCNSIGKTCLSLATGVISAAAYLAKFKGSVLTPFSFLTNFPCCFRGLT